MAKAAAASEPKTAPKRTAWQKDQVEILRDMWLRGASDSELEQSLGRSANAIAIKAHRMGLPPRAKAVAQLSGGETVEMVALGDDYLAPLDRPKPVGKLRRCLMCTVEFWSSHAGERICPDCKGTDYWRSANWMSESGGWSDDW